MAKKTLAQLSAGLLLGAVHHEPHVKAAVQDLIDFDRGHWLKDEAFLEHVTVRPDGDAWIAWTKVREAFDEGDLRAGHSSMQNARLDLAICLATDRFRFSRMSDDEARQALDTITVALAVQD